MKREALGVPTKTARFVETIVSLAQKAVVGRPAPAYQPGEGGYADWVILSIQGLKEYLSLPYRKLMDVLAEMPRITDLLGVTPETLPHFTTVCAAKQLIRMPAWRAVLTYSAELHDLGEIQAIDATGVDRIGANHHYAKRTNYTFRAVKTTALVDCKTSAILDIHCSMTQPHDTKIGWQVLTRNLENLSTVVADKGYDWELLRRRLRAEGVTPVIKTPERHLRGVAKNVLLDDTTYAQRPNVESVFFGLRRRYGNTLWARTRFGQFRELVLKSVVRNVELAIEAGTP